MSLEKTVVRKIKLLREFKNFTQQYVASELNISQNSYSLMEKGLTKLTLDRMEQLAEIFDVNVFELLKDDMAESSNSMLQFMHSNKPPAISPMEKILYEKTIAHLEENVNRLYLLIEKLTSENIVSKGAQKNSITTKSYNTKANKSTKGV